MIHFKGGGIRFYKNIHDDGELSFYKKMVDDKLYIHIEIPDSSYGFKEMAACLTDKTVIESNGFSQSEQQALLEEVSVYEDRMRWMNMHPYQEKWVYNRDENLRDQIQNHFIEAFVPSRDTAAYLASLRHVFSDFEKAEIVLNHELLSDEDKKEALTVLAKITQDSKLADIIQEAISFYMENKCWDSPDLYKKIDIPYDFRHGDIVRIIDGHHDEYLGVLLGYYDDTYEEERKCCGDYSDVQLVVSTRFYENDYLGEFSHDHINPIYVERAMLCHDDTRKAYMDYVAASFDRTILGPKERGRCRIDEIIRMLKNVWYQNPELRLGQLICVASGEKDIFAIEDVELMDELFKMQKGKGD